jgi:hypothetical protein
MSDRKNYTMYIIGNNDSGFDFYCPNVYSIEQAIGYVKHLYGYKIKVRNIREVK